MAVYLSGLVLVTGAIELTLALFLASQGKFAAPSSTFWVVYFAADVAMFAFGGVLVPLGLMQLRTSSDGSPAEPTRSGSP